MMTRELRQLSEQVRTVEARCQVADLALKQAEQEVQTQHIKN